jgi:hypothetical protein
MSLDDSETAQRLRDFATTHWGDAWKGASVSAIEHRLARTLTDHAIRSQDREPSPSLATCEKVPTISDHPEESPDYAETVEELGYVSDATDAIRAALGRDRDRQEKVLALVQAGEVAHAKRLATCKRKSVQLECGHCGSDENFVPMSCGSRLCEDCMNEKMGEVAGQYLPVVENWENPTMIRLSLDRRVKPERVEQAVDALRGAFGRLRRRKVPHDGDGWSWTHWRMLLCANGAVGLAKRLDRERQEGRWVPVEDVIRSGFYGIDIKQKEDGRLNVHMHVLADVPWFPQSALSELWDDLVDAPVVDIRQISSRGSNDEESALMEVIGYAAKAPEYESVEDEVEYFQALKGSKLVQPFGDLHGNTPDSGLPMYCCTCEESPEKWLYLGVVEDGGTCTVGVGSPPDGDRPPP